jgi:hypothetical protein
MLSNALGRLHEQRAARQTQGVRNSARSTPHEGQETPCTIVDAGSSGPRW